MKYNTWLPPPSYFEDLHHHNICLAYQPNSLNGDVVRRMLGDEEEVGKVVGRVGAQNLKSIMMLIMDYSKSIPRKKNKESLKERRLIKEDQKVSQKGRRPSCWSSCCCCPQGPQKEGCQERRQEESCQEGRQEESCQEGPQVNENTCVK